MEIENNDKNKDQRWGRTGNRWEKQWQASAGQRKRKKAMFGLAIVLAGTWWLFRRMDINIAPDWLFTWPVLLILFGVFQLVANAGKGLGGYILLLIGSFFLIKRELDLPITIEPYFWPAVVILLGLVILFKPSGMRRWRNKIDHEESGNGDDTLDSLAVFGGIKKDIFSKNFKGGELTCAMGGIDLYFGRADIESQASIDVTVLMGGVKLVVPSHWNVVVNTTNVMGGVEDKRRFDVPVGKEEKTLTITGLVLMGGVEIKSF